MSITVAAGGDIAAAIQAALEKKIAAAMPIVQRKVAEVLYSTWAGGKFTWSQPNTVWSGQSRGSIAMSLGQPSTWHLPDNPGPWPNHHNPYPARDVFDVLSALPEGPFYGMIILSDAAPHAVKVEVHTHVMHAAAVFTKAHFKNFDWKPLLTAAEDIPF